MGKHAQGKQKGAGNGFCVLDTGVLAPSWIFCEAGPGLDRLRLWTRSHIWLFISLIYRYPVDRLSDLPPSRVERNSSSGLGGLPVALTTNSAVLDQELRIAASQKKYACLPVHIQGLVVRRGARQGWSNILCSIARKLAAGRCNMHSHRKVGTGRAKALSRSNMG